LRVIEGAVDAGGVVDARGVKLGGWLSHGQGGQQEK
jgi:hypothetical protein